MIPYGIIIKQSRASLQQSYILWQKKYGLLSVKKFISTAIPMLSLFAVIYCAVTVVFEKELSVMSLFGGICMNMLLIAFLMYATAIRIVKEYALTAKEEKVQLVLNEDTLEITTAYSKEVVPYSEIDLCFEKNFLLTVITDKNTFPLSVSKTHLVKGDYDTFTALLKSKVPYAYEKRGEC